MRWLRLVIPALFAASVVAFAPPASANHNPDQHSKMDLVFTSPNSRINSDLAFWGDFAFAGYYRNDISVGGFRIFDISDPSRPQQLVDFPCDGLQADPIVWDRNGNDIPDLLLLAVDRTMAGPECGAARVDHDDPNGWEGVRVFTMSDDPADPFATITQVKAQYTDCGAHTITGWPGEIDETGNLLVYVSSYPLRPGPTCGVQNAGSTTNPFDEDPGSPTSSLHGVIQVLEVPLDDPAATREIAQPAITYTGDPDNQIDWCERTIVAPPCPGESGLEPAARACHDIAVHVPQRLAAGACAEQGQVWTIDENGLPDTANPVLISDDEVSSGGTGDIPGAIDFFHSAIFNNDATVVNWVDESFGNGCPPMTTWQPRPWNPAGGTFKTGRMFFSDVATGAFQSEFQVGDLRPEPGAYCSAHMGMPVAGINKDLLVNAWYQGGVDVIDFSNPAKPKEIAFYDMAPAGPTGSDNWSAYAYTGPKFPTGRGIPVYASDGVSAPDTAQGFVVYRTLVPSPGARVVDHLNPQTQEG